MSLLKLSLYSFLLVLTSCSSEPINDCSSYHPICYKKETFIISYMNPVTKEVSLVDTWGADVGTFKIYNNDFWTCNSRSCRKVGDTVPFTVKYKYFNNQNNLIQGVKW